MKDFKIARHKYGVQRAGAKARNIGWHISFEDWYNWWLKHGIDKNIPSSSLDGDQPCMCRNNDTGDYHIDNVYFATRKQNTSDLRKHKKYKTGGAYYKRKVLTPDGIFDTIKEAGKFYNKPGIHYWFKTNKPGFRYID